jgi:hypothetical protein
MGQSTDAILFYGIDYGEDLDLDTLIAESGLKMEDPAFKDLYALKVGIVAPKVEWSENPEVKTAYISYWNQKREASEKAKCELSSHCSDECPMYFVYVKTAYQRAHRGYPVEIETLMVVKPEWREELKEYCELTGLPFKEPKWHLASYWG